MSPVKRIYQTKCPEDLLLFPKIELVKIFQRVILGSVVQELKYAKEVEKHASNQGVWNFLGHGNQLEVFVKRYFQIAGPYKAHCIISRINLQHSQ